MVFADQPLSSLASALHVVVVIEYWGGTPAAHRVPSDYYPNPPYLVLGSTSTKTGTKNDVGNRTKNPPELASMDDITLPTGVERP